MAKRTRQAVADEDAEKRAQTHEPEMTLVAAKRFYAQPTVVLNAPFHQHQRIYNEYEEALEPVLIFWEKLEVDQDAFNSLEHRAGGQALQPLDPGIKDELEPEQLQLAQDLYDECKLLRRAAWKRHVQLRDILKPTSPEEVKESMRHSWILVCRLHLMQARLRDTLQEKEGLPDWPKELFQRAHEFKFAVHVNRHRMPMILCDDAVGLYSVNILMVSLTLWIDAVDTYGWSPSAGQYLEALWLRYCLIVHQPAREVQPGHDLDEWAGKVVQETDDPMEQEEEVPTTNNYDDIFSAPDMPEADPRMAPAPLNTAFLEVAERYFFNCWWHHQSLQSLSSPLSSLPWRIELHQARAAWRMNQGLPALVKMLQRTLKDPISRDSLMASLATHYPQRMPWVGQKEQMMHLYPNEAADGEAESMLSRLRPDAYQDLQKVLHLDKESNSEPMRFVKAYVEQETGLAHFLCEHYKRPPPIINEEGVEEEVPMPFTEAEWLDKDRVRMRLGLHPERFVLLFIEQALNRHLASVEEDLFGSNSFLSVRTMDGAKSRPPESLLAGWRFCQQHTLHPWPQFWAIWQNYTVMAPGTSRWLWTPHLIDALGAWVTLAWWSGEAEQLKSHGVLSGSVWRDLMLPQELLDHLSSTPLHRY